MEKRRIVLVSIVFIFSLFYCVYGLADGGGPLPPPPGSPCVKIPENIDYDGPLIKGTFTAAWDKSQCTVDKPDDYRHYNIHVLLEGVKLEQGLQQGREMPIKKLYSLHAEISKVEDDGNPKSLCEYTLFDWKEKFKYAACVEGVAQYFGFVKKDAPGVATHYPVVTDVWVTQQDNCDDFSQTVISGTIKIRMTEIKEEPQP